MEAAQVDKRSKLVEADVVLHHVVHVRGDALHLPTRQPALRRRIRQRSKARMSPYELHTQEIDRLLQE